MPSSLHSLLAPFGAFSIKLENSVPADFFGRQSKRSLPWRGGLVQTSTGRSFELSPKRIAVDVKPELIPSRLLEKRTIVPIERDYGLSRSLEKIGIRHIVIRDRERLQDTEYKVVATYKGKVVHIEGDEASLYIENLEGEEPIEALIDYSKLKDSELELGHEFILKFLTDGTVSKCEFTKASGEVVSAEEVARIVDSLRSSEDY